MVDNVFCGVYVVSNFKVDFCKVDIIMVGMMFYKNGELFFIGVGVVV